MFLFLGVEMADFELGVFSRAERFLSDQDLEQAIAKVLKTFDGVENLSAEQRDGIANFYTPPRCVGGITTGIRQINVISINSWTLCRTT